MLSGANISAGQAGQYFEKDDYYLKEGGVWQGRGAAALGLHGRVDKDEFKALLVGRDPDGNPLITKKAVDIEQGKDRAGMDLTFSAPKSVSIMALADENVKIAHDKAVSRVLGYIEDHNIQTREQIAGDRQTLYTGNLMAAKFDHLTSRELDPQLHTHCVVMNMTQKENGDWRSLSNETLFDDRIKLGRLYRNELAKNLSDIGYSTTVTDRKQGFFEIKGVDEGLIQVFSKRREQVLERYESLKASGKYPNMSEGQLKEIAALDSRKIKPEHLNKETLKADWEKTFEKCGFTIEGVRAEAKRQAELSDKEPSFTPGELIQKAMEIKTETESVFQKIDIMNEAARLGIGDRVSVDHLESAFGEMQKSGQLVFLGEQKAVGHFSTREMQGIERDIVRRVNESRGKYTPVVDRGAVYNHLDAKEQAQGWSFTDGQRQAALTVLCSTDCVNIIQGDAGTGKTTYTREIKNIMDQNGGSVLGVGFTGKAAAGLKNEGIESMTIDSMIHREIEFIDQDTERTPDSKSLQIKKGSILLMDEASMTGNQHFHKLLKLSEKGGLKLVIQGDKKQLPSISAGRMHEILQEKTTVDKVELREALRQRPGGQAYESVQAFQKKGMSAALDTLHGQGNITEIKDRSARLEAVRDRALSAMRQGSTLVLTNKNKDRIVINQMIREKLVNEDIVKGEGASFNVRASANLSSEYAKTADAYKIGQEVIATAFCNTNIKSGSQWTVKGIDADKNTVTLFDGEKTQSLNVGKYGQNLSVFNIEARRFAEGDHIVFLKNDKKLGVMNGTLGKVASVDENGGCTVSVGGSSNAREVNFSLNETGPGASYNYIDHSYAVTTHKSQGVTVDNCIVCHDSADRMASQNSVYVGMTRARESTSIFTDNLNEDGGLKAQAGEWDKKTSTLDYADFKPKDSIKSLTNRILEKDASGHKKDEPIREPAQEIGRLSEFDSGYKDRWSAEVDQKQGSQEKERGQDHQKQDAPKPKQPEKEKTIDRDRELSL
ncbi:conjugative relaxase [Candidatus Parcubacteria bacterium]|nr:MAG: conjugative relaxase [Candidatus Parcubacteria bacterium]